MSKSLGNVVNPFTLVEEYGTDAVRFYLLAGLPAHNDGDFSRVQFEALYNAKLANGLGNLVSRVATMASKSFPEGLDEAAFESSEAEKAAMEAIEEYDFAKYVQAVWTVVDAANEKIEKEAPFKSVKTNPAAAKKTLSEVAGMIRWVATMLQPVIPASANEILRRYASKQIILGDSMFPRRDASGM